MQILDEGSEPWPVRPRSTCRGRFRRAKRELRRGGVMEDIGRLRHFDHEGRLPGGNVVAGADAGEDAVNETNTG